MSQILPGLDLSSYSRILQGLMLTAVIVVSASETPINCLKWGKICSVLNMFECLDSSDTTV